MSTLEIDDAMAARVRATLQQLVDDLEGVINDGRYAQVAALHPAIDVVMGHVLALDACLPGHTGSEIVGPPS